MTFINKSRYLLKHDGVLSDSDHSINNTPTFAFHSSLVVNTSVCVEILSENNVSTEKNVTNSNNCQHNIVEDLIDITPDRSKYIYYCSKCYVCVSSLEYNEKIST
jgi:hypothetical protein